MMNYEKINACRACQHEYLDELYEHSDGLPIAGIYSTHEQQLNVNMPITVVKCQSCELVQIEETISPVVYMDYHFVGNSAAAYENYLRDLAGELVEKHGLIRKEIFEIGASNGVLLDYLRESGYNNVFGIEPSKKLCEDALQFKIDLFEGYFNSSFVKENPKKYNAVIIRHVLEHIHDLQETIRLIDTIVEEDGIIIVEVPDINETVSNHIYSNIFHEHLNYFSIQTLNALFSQIDFTPLYTKKVDIHGGAVFAIYKKKVKLPQKQFEIQVDSRKIRSFFMQSEKYYKGLKGMVLDLLAQGKTVHGFGASHRTFMILGFADLNREQIPYIFDHNTFLHQKRLNGSGSIIISPSRLHEQKPDVIIIFATSYEKEIIKDLREIYHYEGEIVSVKKEVF